jgi:xanthine/CO dehydrogenase XdhC/CoxF family maturation factor
LLRELAENALQRRASFEEKIQIDGKATRVWVDYRAARPGLWIFGAGDDARPLVRLARELGWFVAVADGRSHLVTQSRFPAADEVRSWTISEWPGSAKDAPPVLPTDAAVLMTHSFEQDSHILAALLNDDQEFPCAYVGVLGPQRRAREALAEAARLRHLTPETDRIDGWLAQLHAPTGIDLGADTSASIALSILAEIQQTLNAATALPLRQVRATKVEIR